jgi:hypothetical protein
MMRRWILAASLCVLPMTLSAAVQLKPGLWSMSVQMAQDMELDPDLVEQMRQMGLQLPQKITPPPNVYDLCITPQQAGAQRLPDIHDPATGCTGRNIVRDGDRASGDLACDGMFVGGGKVQMLLTGPGSFTGQALFRGQSQDGLPLDVRGNLAGTWRAADCGNVQPMN